MKKSLIALAVLAASGAAMAQSSVTLFGVVDAGVSYVNKADAKNNNKYGMHNSGNATSRLGFRGVEDLGGGLKAGFWLEGELSADDGTSGGLNFKRRSTLSLMGNFGEVRLGRDMTAGYSKTASYDVFGSTGIGQFSGWRNLEAYNDTTKIGFKDADVTGVRANNLVSYYTPDFSGFKAGVSYSFHEKTGSSKDGRYVGGNVSYDNGPLSLAVSYDRLNVAFTNVAAIENGKRDALTFGGSYNFGVAKLSGIAQQQKFSFTGAPKEKFNNYAVGVTAPVGGAGEIKAQYAFYDQKADRSKAHQLSLGYVHNLSKRTAVYGTVAHIKNEKGSTMGLQAKGVNTVAAANQKQTGVQVGLRHSF